MKKIFVFILISLIAVSFVSAFVGDREIWYDFDRGWNLVYGFINPLDQLDGQTLESSHIKAVYGFMPTTQEYIRFYPDPEISSGDLWNTYGFSEDEMLNTAFWVYTDKGATSEYWLLDDGIEFELRQMYKGWNFVGITPDMVNPISSSQGGGDIKLQNLKGTCNIEKSYMFDNEHQKWVEFPLHEEFYKEFIGFGWIIKVSNDCKLGSSAGSGTGIKPPGLPGGNGNGVLLEKDFGILNFVSSSVLRDNCELMELEKGIDEHTCDSYNAKYDTDGPGLQHLEVIVEVRNQEPTNKEEVVKAIANNVADQNGMSVETSTWNGNKFYSLDRSNGITEDRVTLWASGNKIIAISVDNWDYTLIDDDVIEVLLMAYFNKYPSDLKY